MNLDKSTLGTLFLLIFSVLLGCSSVHEEEAQTAFYINAGKSAESQNVRTFETICKEDQCSFQIHTGPNVEPVKVMLANIDSVYPVSLYLTKAAWPDLRSNGAIVESIISEDMSEEDKAIALWKFVSKRSYHAEPRSEVSHDLHDPVKLLNIFGYGYCGDLNGALVCLAELSGFETRFWVLEGHTVAEMYYDKEWHMFDAVYEVYYYDDSMKIVGVEYLSQYPEVILNSDIDLSYDRLFRKYFNSSASTDEKTELSVHQKYILQNFENLQISFKAEFKVADDEELTFDMMRERMLYNYAKFYTTANDNWIEEGRGANYTTHEMNILLYPKEELIYSFSQLNNEGLKIACYGSRNKCYEGRGSLIRKLSKNRFEQGSEK
ncbi:MAG TPA: transglutaminase domain-containing protein [Flavobacteriales bacterium]|nr:transglutaminase domain-containing protein [Flavobacteriales bacterium]